jgi:hypothetical protein
MEVSKRKENRWSAERFDVLEDELPRQACQVLGCCREARYEWAGAFGTRWLCSRHRPLYRAHDRILARIRRL